MEGKRFPILTDVEPKPYSGPTSIPWDMLVPHEGIARQNHSQDLETLARRGGLAVCEAVAVLEGQNWNWLTRVNHHLGRNCQLGCQANLEAKVLAWEQQMKGATKDEEEAKELLRRSYEICLPNCDQPGCNKKALLAHWDSLALTRGSAVKLQKCEEHYIHSGEGEPKNWLRTAYLTKDIQKFLNIEEK